MAKVFKIKTEDFNKIYFNYLRGFVFHKSLDEEFTKIKFAFPSKHPDKIFKENNIIIDYLYTEEINE